METLDCLVTPSYKREICCLISIFQAKQNDNNISGIQCNAVLSEKRKNRYLKKSCFDFFKPVSSYMHRNSSLSDEAAIVSVI